jgi:hypothetical protein
MTVGMFDIWFQPGNLLFKVCWNGSIKAIKRFEDLKEAKKYCLERTSRIEEKRLMRLINED